MTKALPHVENMSPYALADMTAPAGMRLVSLSQNESLRGPSPKAVAAAAACLIKGGNYPEPDWFDLRHALADLHGIPAQGILCGSGSLDLIACVARAYAGPDRTVLTSAHAYPFFRTAAQMANARLDIAPETDCCVDVDALLAGVQADTALVFVANPGNPTGTRIPKSELLRLRAGLRDDILLVIDEAYGEFSDHMDAPCWDMVEANCIVLRTLSKAYSMAGFRVGWGLFPDVIAGQVRKVMNPNNLTSASQAAAVAAVLDQTYMRETCTMTSGIRQQAILSLRSIGFEVRDSVTNFVLILFADEDTASQADAALSAQGVFLRRQQGAGLPHALRMTIGPEPDTQKAIDHLERWKREAQT
ncbi:histidinol-phosphate transaminase [uncultured Tateyamaria sp.]|uniref:pyridoxal phosphate-dependent aminotransferase n=1 Tax=uncultured Tateyamaria sp. TaxID=455651 RepID=UPI0026231F18|nr:histidinol-phosphate transaminase [uncultured Tateyamaria sp.]